MSPAHKRPAVHVVAAAITDATGRVLIAQRPPGKHLAGGWEFPGGKVGPGEKPLQALSRELREELGIEIGAGPHRPVRRVRHAYPDCDVFMEVWLVRDFAGLPQGLDGQTIRWCVRDCLYAVPLLPADAPIVEALRLPEYLVDAETSDYSIGIRKHSKLLGALCLSEGDVLEAENACADFVVLRNTVAKRELTALCRATMLPVFARGFDLKNAWDLGATGIHQLVFQKE